MSVPVNARNTNITPSDLCVTATAVSGTGVTLTLPAAVGQFHRITQIVIILYNSADRAGAATPILVTSTNLPGTPVWSFPTLGTTGQILHLILPYGDGGIVSSVVGTETTIVAPATVGVIWRITAHYRTSA